MSSFGKFVTSVTSKFGIVSRKAAMRLATETGMAIVDEGARLGRKLTVDEMASVMRRTLPKRCCPKLLSSRQEVADQIVRAGLATPQQASQIANNPKMLGGCVNNGTKKTTIFVVSNPKIPAEFEYNFFSHELEHALEYNNRIKGIWNRKTQPFKLFLKNIFNGSEKSKDMQYVIQTAGGNFQAEVQQALGTFLTPKNFVLSCSPTREGLMELNGMSENRYLASIRRVLNKYVNAKSQGSMNNTMLSCFKRVIDLEIPAYTVGGRVYEYAKGLAKGQHSVSTGTAVLYRDAQNVIKQEQKLYWFNKLFGKLRKPTVFHSQKDLINLARTKEERKIINSYDKLLKVNSDMVGWLTVKGVEIDYPVVRTTDNSYYLKRNFYKEKDYNGWVFMDYRNNSIELNDNTIIYAHNRFTSGVMFGQLPNIRKKAWLKDKNNYDITFNTLYENGTWRIFSYYSIDVTSDYLITTFIEKESYQEFLDMITKRSEHKFDTKVTTDDKILTLSTCLDNNQRFVVHAVLVNE